MLILRHLYFDFVLDATKGSTIVFIVSPKYFDLQWNQKIHSSKEKSRDLFDFNWESPLYKSSVQWKKLTKGGNSNLIYTNNLIETAENKLQAKELPSFTCSYILFMDFKL